MGYKLYDKDNNEIILKDLQNKAPWYEDGKTFERVFIEKYGEKLGLVINPEKKKDKYVVDLFNTKTNNLGELKTQNTPFFQALKRYSIDPQYAVTFNKKDYLRYSKFYQDLEIYYWIDWVAVKFESDIIIEVEPMTGIWQISFDDIRKLVDIAPLHYYQQRINDFTNNKGSYVLDLNDSLFRKVD